jgi:hypothetical protein
MQLSLSIDPLCGSVGTRMTATVDTKPRAKISLVVAYSDAKDRGQKGFFDADERGRYVYRWTIPPDVPMGDGRVLVSVADGEGNGAGGAWPFRVAPKGRC